MDRQNVPPTLGYASSAVEQSPSLPVDRFMRSVAVLQVVVAVAVEVFGIYTGNVWPDVFYKTETGWWANQFLNPRTLGVVSFVLSQVLLAGSGRPVLRIRSRYYLSYAVLVSLEVSTAVCGEFYLERRPLWSHAILILVLNPAMLLILKRTARPR